MKNKFTSIYDKLIQEQTQFVKKQFLHKLISEQDQTPAKPAESTGDKKTETTTAKPTAGAKDKKEDKVEIPQEIQRFKDHFVKTGIKYKKYKKQKLEKGFDDWFNKGFICAFIIKNKNNNYEIKFVTFKYLAVDQAPDRYYKRITDSWEKYQKQLNKTPQQIEAEQRQKQQTAQQQKQENKNKALANFIKKVKNQFAFNVDTIIEVSDAPGELDTLHTSEKSLYSCNGNFIDVMPAMSTDSDSKEFRKYISNTDEEGNPLHPVIYADIIWDELSNESWDEIDNDNVVFIADKLMPLINNVITLMDSIQPDYQDFIYKKAKLKENSYSIWKQKVTKHPSRYDQCKKKGLDKPKTRWW